MKEHRYKIQTETGNVKKITPKLLGDLKTLIVKTNYRIGISIESELGYCLWKNPDITAGVYYVPLRATAQRRDNDLVYTAVPYTLNEKLIIYVVGPNDTEVEIILRID